MMPMEGTLNIELEGHRPTIKCATYQCFHVFPIMLSLLWGGG